MFEIIKYSQDQKHSWNQFVSNSKNGTFLFDRNYMDYHSDRFCDHSLMIFRKGKLYALFPANEKEYIFYSHQGLTYGGMIINDKATALEMVNVFALVNDYLRQQGFQKVVYKAIPWIYHQHPAQEDLYAMFRNSSSLHIVGRNISSTIIQDNKIRFIESRKSGIRKAIANNIIVRKSDDLVSFWKILDTNLRNKYGVAPVHTLEEMQMLQLRFPQNIKLYLAYRDDEVLGGTLLYLTKQVVHTQYISANLEGKAIGALDILFDYIINQEYTDYPYFDFGQSTEEMGHVLNESLIFQKEGFGGRGVCYDIYEYNL